eukprot:gene5183-5705_t
MKWGLKGFHGMTLSLYPLIGLIFTFFSFIHSFSTDHSSSSSSSPQRVLIVTIDNRPLSWDSHDTTYLSKTSVINYEYALYHEYDYLYLQNQVDDLIPRVRSYYPQAIEDEMMKTEQVAKDIASGFNVLSKEYRAASWAKLPALWNITMQFQGSFIFRPTQLAEQVFRQWWDYHLPTKNFKHFHEQDALWLMLTYPKHGFLLTKRDYLILSEKQFPSDYIRYEDLWLVHIASYNYHMRLPILNQFLRLLRRNLNSDTFHEAIDMIETYHTYLIDPLLTAMRMEEKSIIEEQEGHIHRLHQWPSLPKNEEEWYNQHVTSKTMLTLPLGQLMEGRLVRFRKEIFIVFNETKRPFASYDAFLQLKLHEELCHSLTRHQYNNIPIGKMIEEGLSIEEKQLLLTYYQPLPIAFHHHHHHHYGQGSSNGSGSGIGSSSEKRKKEEVIGNGSGRQSYYGHRINEFHYKFEREAVTPTGGSGGGSGSASSHHHHRGNNSSRECLIDTELQDLMNGASYPKIHAKMYIIGHNTDSLNIAKAYAYCKESYMKLLSIPSTVFFESIVYETLLPKVLQDYWDIETHQYQIDYLILGTYKTVGKSLAYNSYTQSLTNVRVLLRYAAKHPEYDILPFLRSGSSFMPFALYFHGPIFEKTWDLLLSNMGYNQSIIQGFDHFKQIFFRNIYIIKPRILAKLCDFMTKAIKVSREVEEVRLALSHDSKYKEGEVSVARKIFGTDYYQLHPFIFERLPAFFFYSTGLKICQETTGPCKYNS